MQVNKETFCVLPFIHTVLNPYDSSKHNTNALPCCRYAPSNTEFFENTDPINKSKTWIQLQEQFLNNEKPSDCYHCWRDEEHNTTSYRQQMLSNFSKVIDDGSYKEKKLLFLELMFGNTCNLACRSCGSTFSSKWLPINNYLHANNIQVTSHTNNIKFTNWKELDLTNLIQLKIMGGEPLYQKDALELLEHLSNIGVLKNIQLSIPTNCTIQLNDRWKELLLEAKKVNFYLSIDAYGKLNDYIRSGSDWDTVEKNLYSFYEFVKQHQHKIHASVNTVVSVYNVNRLFELEEYIKEEFHWAIYGDIAQYPSYLDIGLLPNHIKNNIIASGVSERITGYLKSKEYSEKDFEKLKNVTSLLDKYNKKNLKDYNPKMYNWIIND
jgi:organic radical activating enzyme